MKDLIYLFESTNDRKLLKVEFYLWWFISKYQLIYCQIQRHIPWSQADDCRPGTRLFAQVTDVHLLQTYIECKGGLSLKPLHTLSKLFLPPGFFIRLILKTSFIFVWLKFYIYRAKSRCGTILVHFKLFGCCNLFMEIIRLYVIDNC